MGLLGSKVRAPGCLDLAPVRAIVRLESGLVWEAWVNPADTVLAQKIWTRVEGETEAERDRETERYREKRGEIGG